MDAYRDNFMIEIVNLDLSITTDSHLNFGSHIGDIIKNIKVRPIFIPEIDNRIIDGKIIGSNNRKILWSIVPVF